MQCYLCGSDRHDTKDCKMRKTKLVVVFLAGALIVGPAPGVEITMTEAELAQCEAEGGCELLTRKAILSLLGMAERIGFEAGKKAYRNST